MPETSLHGKDLAAKKCLNARAEPLHQWSGQELVRTRLDRSGHGAAIMLGQWMGRKEAYGLVNLTRRGGGGKVTCRRRATNF